MGMAFYLHVDKGKDPGFISDLIASELETMRGLFTDEDCDLVELLEESSDDDDPTHLHPGSVAEEVEKAIELIEDADDGIFRRGKDALVDELESLKSCVESVGRRKKKTLVYFSLG